MSAIICNGHFSTCANLFELQHIIAPGLIILADVIGSHTACIYDDAACLHGVHDIFGMNELLKEHW